MTKNVILNGLIMRFSHTIISLCIDYDAARTGIRPAIVTFQHHFLNNPLLMRFFGITLH